MSSGLRSAAAALLAMGSRASAQLFLIAVTLVATRYLSPADFGVFAIATAFVTLARTLLYTGPFEYLMKAPDLDACATECLASTVLMAAAAGVVLLLLAGASPWLFSSSGVAVLLLVLIPSNFIAAFASWEEALLLRSGNTRAYYIITTVVELVTSLAAIVLLVLGWKLWALVAQIYVRLVVIAIVYRLQIRPPALRRPDLVEVRTVSVWSTSRYGATFVSFLSNYSGDLILGSLLSPAATGLFRAGNRVVTAASDMFSQPARLLAMTGLSTRAATGRPADGTWFEMFVGIGFIGCPALVLLALVGDWLAPVALGKQWAGVGTTIAILSIARALGIPNAVMSSLLVTYNRQRTVFTVQLVSAIAAAATTIALSPWGVNGAAMAALGVALFVTIWMTWLALTVAPLSREEIRRILPILVVPIVTVAIGTLAGRWLAIPLGLTGPPRLVVAVACGGLGWLAALALLFRPFFRALHVLTATGAQRT